MTPRSSQYLLKLVLDVSCNRVPLHRLLPMAPLLRLSHIIFQTGPGFVFTSN